MYSTNYHISDTKNNQLSILLDPYGGFQNKTRFIFNNSELNLLYGESGRGKSTITEAIMFALTGNPVKIPWNTDNQSHKKKHKKDKCRVILEYDKWKICRESGKDKIEVFNPANKSNPLIGKEAQAAINIKFGSSFGISSCIADGATSFIFMRPAEKMAYLENLAISGYDTDELLNKCKDYRKIRKELESKQSGIITMLEAEVKEHPFPTKIEWPLTGKYSDKKINNQRTIQSNNKKIMVTYSRKLQKLIIKQNNAQLNQQKYNQLNNQSQLLKERTNKLITQRNTIKLSDIQELKNTITQIHNIHEVKKLENELAETILQYHDIEELNNKNINEQLHRIQKINNEITSLTTASSYQHINIDKIEQQITWVNNNTQLIELNKQLELHTQDYNNLSLAEKQAYQSELEQLNNIPAINNKQEQLRSTIHKIKKYQQLSLEYKELEEQTNNYDSPAKYIEAIKELQEEEKSLIHHKVKITEKLKIHNCPKCKTFLRLGNSGLELIDNTLDTNTNIEFNDTKSIDKRLKIIHTDINDYTKAQYDADILITKINTITGELELITKELNNETLNINNKLHEAEYALKIHTEELEKQTKRSEQIKLLEMKLNNNTVSPSLLVLSQKIKTLKNTINTLKKKLTGIPDDLSILNIQTLLQQLNEAKINNERFYAMENKIKQLKGELLFENKKLSELEISKADITDKKSKKINGYNTNINVIKNKIPDEYKNKEWNLEYITNEYEQAKYNLQEYNNLELQIKQNNNELEELTRQINIINLDTNDYPLLIKELENKIKECQELDIKYDKLEQDILAFITYINSYKVSQSYVNKLEEAKNKYYSIQAEIATVDKLRAKIHDAKAIAISSLLEKINLCITYYLNKFFEDPIAVEFSAFTEIKHKEDKPKINVRCSYKGNEPNITELSKGERARLELATCLAINKIVESNILILDEPFSNLHESLINELTHLLRKEANETGKLIIIISHNIQEEGYDNVIHL